MKGGGRRAGSSEMKEGGRGAGSSEMKEGGRRAGSSEMKGGGRRAEKTRISCVQLHVKVVGRMCASVFRFIA